MKGGVRKKNTCLAYAENPALPWLPEELQIWSTLSKPPVLRFCSLGHSEKWQRRNFTKCDKWKTRQRREMMHSCDAQSLDLFKVSH